MTSQNLDRRIRLVLRDPGEYVNNEYVPGPGSTMDVWASQIDRGQSYRLDAGGAITTRAKSFVMRYIPRLVEGIGGEPPLTPVDVSLYDEHGIPWRVESIGEIGQERRRFMEIECTSGTGIDSDSINPPGS